MAAEPSPLQVAVLVMAYGGPGSIDEVEPYLMDVRGGRPTKPQLVDEIRARYARIGGRSPILDLTRAQAVGIGRALGDRFRVYVGMRHWRPYIQETVEAIVGAGQRRVVGVAMAPHYSNMSVGAYEKKLLQAAGDRLETSLIRSWWSHPRFLDAVTDRVTQALQRFPSPSAVPVIFTAHSLPEHILASADPYPEEIRRSAEDVITELAKSGHKGVLLVPIGFVCDHVEILYDIDVEYQAVARRLGLQLERTASLNDDAGLVAAVADVVRTAASERGWL